MENDKHFTTSKVLQDVVDKNTVDTLTFRDIKLSLHEQGFGLVLLIFSLPLTIVPPGITLVASFPVLLFSFQMLMALDSPWLPKWLGDKSIKRTTLASIIEKTSPYLRKVERLLQPRLYFASSRKGEQIIGLFAFIFSISITIPLPLTNLLPAIGISIMSLGLLNKDGLVIILGMIVGTIGCTITIIVLFLGKAVMISIISNITNFLLSLFS